MTFEEIAEMLPNGFHDAKLSKLTLDLAARSIELEIDLLVGQPDTATTEGYRKATLVVLSPVLFFVEPPDPHYPFTFDGSPINIEGDSVSVGQSTSVAALLSVLPSGAVTYRFFLEQWNSFLYLAGMNIEFSWDIEV